ncbi:MAG: DUF1223 domain-containing protein [Candidatus Omnitrophica bacterium]|nr:DUF1223 domain-containing protein [Candidatus Omnitrophota bacterium]
MKQIWIKRMFVFLAALMVTGPSKAFAQSSTDNFAVIELFTSEGCSSCPPADQLLRDLTKKADNENINIFTMSMHVDYWNNLGWKDPYSQNQFTRRQYRYADHFNQESVYTPQMIINGQYAFSGYRRDLAVQYIEEALSNEASYILNVKPEHENNHMTVAYMMNPLPANARIYLAVVERHLTQKVISGENRGIQLKHDNVVRLLESQHLKDKKGEFTIYYDPSWHKDSLSLVVFVQQLDNLNILAAKQAKIEFHL